MSRYLLDERPLTVQPTLCAVLGITRAVILQEIHWLLGQPRSGKIIDRVELADGRVFEGAWWIWNTTDEWREFFAWLPADSIRKHLAALEADRVLVSCQPAKVDRTKHYTIDYEAFERLIESHPSGKNCHMEAAEIADSNRQSIESWQPAKIAGASIDQKRQSEMSAEMTTRGADAPAVSSPTSTPLQDNRMNTDGLTDYFDRATHIASAQSAKVISAWKGSEEQRAMCIAFAVVFDADVNKTDRGKWMAGATKLLELGATYDDLSFARDITLKVGAYLTHPGAVYEWIKSSRAKGKAPNGATTTTTVEPAGLATLRAMMGGNGQAQS